mmetsp:Transcript_34229/g.102231  ORF Transcript_34229/g.102231 Transcript_34229/m.102231 type:complete len:301 (+) Transcript_34229:755-1657(+)
MEPDRACGVAARRLRPAGGGGGLLEGCGAGAVARQRGCAALVRSTAGGSERGRSARAEGEGQRSDANSRDGAGCGHVHAGHCQTTRTGSPHRRVGASAGRARAAPRHPPREPVGRVLAPPQLEPRGRRRAGRSCRQPGYPLCPLPAGGRTPRPGTAPGGLHGIRPGCAAGAGPPGRAEGPERVPEGAGSLEVRHGRDALQRAVLDGSEETQGDDQDLLPFGHSFRPQVQRGLGPCNRRPCLPRRCADRRWQLGGHQKGGGAWTCGVEVQVPPGVLHGREPRDVYSAFGVHSLPGLHIEAP